MMNLSLKTFGFCLLLCLPGLQPEAEAGTGFGAPQALRSQQQVRVSGTVLDNEGEPLPGVTIVVEGSTRGVTTDIDGTYTIDVRPTDKLVFSFIGFAAQTIDVAGQTGINVTLQPKSSELEEVTVVGYGTQRKESVIGAISTISVKDLRMPVGKVSTSLAGQMAGVVAVQRSGEPGAGADFWIRGVSTFGTNNRPLILVDGVERSLDLVDTEDIETFSILKDATATAVYGVRGANGVVLITTRRGVEGKPRVSARAEYGILSPTKMPDMVNAEQFIKLMNDVSRDNTGRDYYSPEVAQRYLDRSDPDLYPNVDWIDEIYKDAATSQRVNLNVTGGTENVKYYVAGSYYNENGIYNAAGGEYNPEMKWTKYNFRSNVDINLSKSTVLNVNLSTQYDVLNRPNSKSGNYDMLWTYTYRTIPIAIAPIYSDGSIARNMGAGYNPYNTLNKTGYVKQFNMNAQSLIGLTQDFSDLVTPGLKMNVKFSWDAVNTSRITRSLNPQSYYASGRDADGNLILVSNNVANASDALVFNGYNEGSRRFYMEASATYERLFAQKHRVGALILYNMGELTNTNATTYTPSIPGRNLGIAGRVTYSYMDKYFAEGNFGYNGSENFAPAMRYGFFPSIAAGWMLSSEEFFAPLRPTISLLKLKVSHGMSGNDKIGDPDDPRRFAFNSDMNNGAAGWPFGDTGGTTLTGLAIGYPGNPNVGWEESTKTNAGIEIGLFNQWKLMVDYFHEHRDKIFILRQSVPSVVGVNINPYVNLGEMENRGIDATMEYNAQLNKDLFVSARANFTYNRNKRLYDDAPTPVMRYKDPVGRPLYQQFGLVSLGYFSSPEDIANSPTQTFGPVRPGDLKYRDINGDNLVDANDEVAIGRTHLPEVNYGFGASAMWKNIDLSLFFQGVGNVTGFVTGAVIWGFQDNYLTSGTFSDIADNRWTVENPDPNAKYPRLSNPTSQNNRQNSSQKQQNMGFMRLKSAELGYTLPKRWTDKVKLSTCRIYLQGVNLLTFSEFDLWDPEISDGTGYGQQGAIYPNMRTVNIGINLNF